MMEEIGIGWFNLHLLTELGFLLALLLLSRIVRERRSPTSTLAWLMGMVFVPYIAVPLYLLFGGRKMRQRVATKGLLPANGRGRSAVHGVFPQTRGNEVRLIADGEEAYEETLRLIAEARHSIHVATFILGADPTGKAVLAALTARAAEGVQVRLLLDSLGSFHLPAHWLTPLQENGGRIAYFMPMMHLPFRGRANLRNHRKLLLFDGQTAISGGMNIAAEYMGAGQGSHRWRDLAVRIAGPAVADLESVFASDWRFAARERLDATAPPVCPVEAGPDSRVQIIATGPDVRGDPLRDTLITACATARHRVWAVTPYFVPDDVLIEVLCIAARRQVDVRLLLPRRSNHRMADLARENYLSQLQEAGGKVFLHGSAMVHAKAVLLDREMAITGSANMDIRSLLLNYELGICLYSGPLIAAMEDWMLQLMRDCEERPPHPNATLGLLEGVGRLFAPLL